MTTRCYETKTLQKWNDSKQVYESHIIPAEWECSLEGERRDFKSQVNCAQCGKVFTYADGYTSRVIHDKLGFGYCVCADCFRKENIKF